MSLVLPAGTVTFLFTDVEGSTSIWEDDPEGMRGALARHDELLRSVIEGFGGYVFTTAGDSFAAAFDVARDAAGAALEAQRVLAGEVWVTADGLRVRMALHSGTAELRDGDYFGPVLNRVARLLAIAHGGQIVLSQSAASLLGDGHEWVLSDLGRHRLKDLAGSEQVFQLSVEPDRFPALRSLDAFPNNLPVQLTSFVGRADQVVEVSGLVETERLVTLTGVGGSGKTRLALQAAGSAVQGFSDGAWFVELAPVVDPSMVPQAVTESLGIAVRQSTSALDALTRFVTQRRLLLFLDNCEHVLDAVAELVEGLLRVADGLHVLATSREGLGVGGERVWRVPSMRVGGGDGGVEGDESEAVQLFVQRATAVLPGFDLTSETAPSVVSICRRLDGMPLAIELAAARTKVLPVDQIEERLSDRFRLLTGGARTVVPRQQTLLATVNWSYDLLSSEETLLFDRLAVFRAGFSLDAAEVVCGVDGLDPSDVLDLLTQLVDKSLVAVEGGVLGVDRFHMLETLRQFSSERLAFRKETDKIRRRHADYFLAFANTAEPLLETEAMAEWLNRLETEHDNFRAALDWMLDAGETTDALEMTTALSVWFWFLHRHHDEAYQWHERTLNAATDAPDVLLAAAYAKASMQAARVRRFEVAVDWADKALAYASTTGDRRAAIIARWTHGEVVMARDYDHQAVLDHYQHALGLSEDAQDDIWTCRLTYFISMILSHLDRHDEASAYADRSLDVGRQVGWPMGIAEAADLLATYALNAGDVDRAVALAEESLSIEKELGDPWEIGGIFATLAAAERLQGHPQRALALAKEALDTVGRRTDQIGSYPLFLELAYSSLAVGEPDEAIAANVQLLEVVHGTRAKYATARALACAATILISQDQPDRAVQLFATAERLFEESIRAERFEQKALEASITDAREETGPKRFTEAWNTGLALDSDQATTTAIEWLTQPDGSNASQDN